MEYALVSPENTIKEYSTRVDPATRRMRPGWRWLPVEVTTPITSDPNKVIEGPVITVLVDKVTRVWTIRDKTAEEIDAVKEQRLNDFDMLVLKILFDLENRTRVLEGKQQITAAQYRAALKARL